MRRLHVLEPGALRVPGKEVREVLSKLLFIGGHADGYVLEVTRGVPDQSVPVLRRSHSFTMISEDGEPMMDQIPIEVYERQHWNADGEQIDIMVLKGMTPAQAFQMLLRGYRHPK